MVGLHRHPQERLFNELLPSGAVGQLCSHERQITPQSDVTQIEENALANGVVPLFVLGDAVHPNEGVGTRNWHRNRGGLGIIHLCAA